MKSLGVYLKHYKKESIIAPFFKLLEVVFDLLVPMVVAQIIDVGIAGNNRPYIVSRFGILVLMAAVGLCCSFTAQYFAAKASVGCATELRQAVFDHIQALSFTELDTIGTDTLITRLINDINQVQNGINMGLRLLLRSPFIVFGSVVMAFTVNVKCAIVFLVTIPILFVAVFGIMLVSIPLFKKVQAALDRVTGMTRENLNGVRVIRAFCREEQSVADFEKSNDVLTCLNEFVGKISALLNPLTYVLINIAAVVLIWQAGLQVNIGSMQQGQVVALHIVADAAFKEHCSLLNNTDFIAELFFRVILYILAVYHDVTAGRIVEGKQDQLDFMLEQNGKNLSGGQKQRLSIARALVKKPEILILDDSSSALDFATDAKLRKAVHNLEGNTTTFLVSQRIAGIRQADQILVLGNGTLEGNGTHDELMKTCEVYREIYFSQFPEERAAYNNESGVIA